ncbi:MAG TPA: 1-acyl-sn-glycerol-3-phosphate acyltransferase, partial [Burkholderiaceae bacterium]|nr:1-acyl-sn-glycerol-3-phosphate acyltransferase [Burkholderiaceae bacterium]
MRKLVAVYDYAVLYLGLTWLGVLCLAWTPFAMVLNPILPDKWARPLGRWVIMAAFNLYIKSLSASRRVHFDISALDALRGEGPMIIAPNHPCILDAVMVISRLPNVACVMKTSLKRNIFL